MPIKFFMQTWFSQPYSQMVNRIYRAITAALILSYALSSILSPLTGFDWYNAFLKFGQNPLKETYPSWLFLVFGPITHLPNPFAWFTALNALLLIASIFLIDAPTPWLVINLPIFWIFFYGQIDGWVVFGSLLGLWAIKKKNSYALGVSLLCLAAKPHIGIPLAVFYFMQMPRLKSLVVPAVVAAISFLLYGFWPIHYVNNYLAGGSGLYDFFVLQQVNISLWPWSLALIPILFWKWKSMSLEYKAVTIMAANCLILPYSPVYSLATLVFLASTRPILLLLLIPAWFSKSSASFSGMLYSLATFALFLFTSRKNIDPNILKSRQIISKKE